jgi:undecaprenyl diphosphate synthase
VGDPERVPKHVAIIMDGNGRWAARRGWHRIAGHRAGTENIREVLRAAADFGVRIVTVYAFSTENWARPEDEVRGLFAILGQAIRRETAELHRNDVRIRHIGDLDGIPVALHAPIREAVELTRHNRRITLNVALNYGGRAEIVRAVRELVREGVAPDAIDEAAIGRRLYTAGQPDPDLVIRTGGEMRLSNFLLWQSSYAEYYATPTYWPDFGRDELRRALEAFAGRHRRFGKL